MSAFATLLERVLAERLEGKLPQAVQTLLGRKSRWPAKSAPDAERQAERLLRSAARYDPTPQRQYLLFIAKQIANGSIVLPEDGPFLHEALDTFHRRQRDWSGKGDVFAYHTWRELQHDVQRYQQQREQQRESNIGTGSVKQREKALRLLADQGLRLLFEQEVLTTNGNKAFRWYGATNWAAASYLGRGTQWCTSASPYRERALDAPRAESADALVAELAALDWSGTPWDGWSAEKFLSELLLLNGVQSSDELSARVRAPNPYLLDAKRNAENYLPLFILLKDGVPYLQLDKTGSEIMNANNVPLLQPGPALRTVFRTAVSSGRLPDALCERLRRRYKL